MMPRKGREEAEGWGDLLKYFCVSQMPNLKIPRKKAVSGFGFMGDKQNCDEYISAEERQTGVSPE